MKLFKKKDCCNNFSKYNMSQTEKLKKEEGIKILGSGCTKCTKLEKSVIEAVTQMNLDLPIEHITDFAQIATYGVMSTPALVLNGEVVSFGKVLSVEEVKQILSVKMNG